MPVVSVMVPGRLHRERDERVARIDRPVVTHLPVREQCAATALRPAK